MGFETSINIEMAIHRAFVFETSLWDLKLLFLVMELTKMVFETSLWDLKLLVALAGVALLSPVRNLPMGFETRRRSKRYGA